MRVRTPKADCPYCKGTGKRTDGPEIARIKPLIDCECTRVVVRKHKPSAVRFFFSHAGYSYDPKTETKVQGRWKCARALATAEKHAKTYGITFEWPYDDTPCIGCECGSNECPCFTQEPHETLGCIARGPDGEQLASLWGICGATTEYTRVVQAELAQEAIAELQRQGAEVNA